MRPNSTRRDAYTIAYPFRTQERSERPPRPRWKSVPIWGRATFTMKRSREASTTPAHTIASTRPGAASGVEDGRDGDGDAIWLWRDIARYPTTLALVSPSQLRWRSSRGIAVARRTVSGNALAGDDALSRHPGTRSRLGRRAGGAR